METMSFKDETSLVSSSQELGVNLEVLADLTGFPSDYIRKELLLENEGNLTVEELRERVMAYLLRQFS